MKINFLFLLLLAACGANGEEKSNRDLDLGIIPIGTTSVDLKLFKNTNCEQGRKMNDCSAMDDAGRQYIFFDGALSKVSVDAVDAIRNIVLPANLEFGENIHKSARKAENIFRTKFEMGRVNEYIVYSSGADIRSMPDVFYSTELIADKNDRLIKIIQRADF